MTYLFDSNEFTAYELLRFFNTVYRGQLNGSPFTSNSLQNWRRQNKIPEAYGGYKIISTLRYEHLGNLLVFKIDGLKRYEVEEMIGSLSENNSTVKLSSELNNIKRPRKQRTKLYYKILSAAGKQYTKKTLALSTLPLYWKEAGIKKNQLVNKSKSKKIK